MSSGNLGEILAKIRARRHKGKEAMRDCLVAVQKATPAGGGDPAGVADSDWQFGRRSCQSLPGTLGGGDRHPTDEKDIACPNDEQKRAIGMAPMHEPHAFDLTVLNAANAQVCSRRS